MNITTILGSPRIRGNTATILHAFEEVCADSHHIKRINITRKQVKGCLGCEACQKVLDEPGCVHKDDFHDIIATMLDADLIVYASPVYVWDFTAQLKTLLDRHCCLVKWKNSGEMKFLMEDKHTVLLTTCGGDAENNADLIQEIFQREMAYLHCRVMGSYVIPLCDSTLPTRLGDKAKRIAQQMYSDLIT